MNISVDWSDGASIRRAFTWLTRSGIGPSFGSRPISWYQMHQCAALDVLKDRVVSIGGNGDVRVHHGNVQARNASGAWEHVGVPFHLYLLADKRLPR